MNLLLTNNNIISIIFLVAKPVMRYKRAIDHPHIYNDMVIRAKLLEWLYGAPPLDIPETILSTIYEDVTGEGRETYIDDNKLREHGKGYSDEVLKYVVKSIVDDALPKVFRESIFEEANANRVKRLINENNTVNMNTDEITDWLTQIRPDVHPNDDTAFNVATSRNGEAIPYILHLL